MLKLCLIANRVQGAARYIHTVNVGLLSSIDDNRTVDSGGRTILKHDIFPLNRVMTSLGNSPEGYRSLTPLQPFPTMSTEEP